VLRNERVCETHQPEDELKVRWPEWSVLDTVDLPLGSEAFYVPLKAVAVNSDGDREWAMAHVLAHLDLGHHLTKPDGDFGVTEEDEADLMARIRLDVLRADMAVVPEVIVESGEFEWADIPVDGPPTVRLRRR
jgi:hypothetical protein